MGPAVIVTQPMLEAATGEAHLPRPLVAGLDVLTADTRDADHIGHLVASDLLLRGARGIVVATHFVQMGDLRHLALSVQAQGVDTSEWFEALAEAAIQAGGGMAGLSLGACFVGSPGLREPVAAAVSAHSARASGRVVVFPGSTSITGTVSVAHILARTAIDRIAVLAGMETTPDMDVRTRDFVRPRWLGGDLVLEVQPSVGGALVPFETPFPTPCCALPAAGARAATAP